MILLYKEYIIRHMNLKFKNKDYDLNDFNVSLVTDMSELFADYYHPKINIANWDVSNVLNMTGMFRNRRYNGDLSKWDIHNDCDIDYAFTTYRPPENSIFFWHELIFHYKRPKDRNKVEYARKIKPLLEGLGMTRVEIAKYVFNNYRPPEQQETINIDFGCDL